MPVFSNMHLEDVKLAAWRQTGRSAISIDVDDTRRRPGINPAFHTGPVQDAPGDATAGGSAARAKPLFLWEPSSVEKGKHWMLTCPQLARDISQHREIVDFLLGGIPDCRPGPECDMLWFNITNALKDLVAAEREYARRCRAPNV